MTQLYTHKVPNPPLRKGHGPRTAPPTEIAVHNTANLRNPSAASEAKYAAEGTGAVSYHFAVDESETWLVQPLDYTAIHAGDRHGNLNSIGIEIARSMDYETDRYARAETRAATLVAQLMHEYGIGMDQVKRHHDYSGKICPHRMFEVEEGKTTGRTWQQFRALVQSEYDRLTTPTGTWHRVQIGAYRDRANAERMLEQVKKTFPQAYIATSTETAPEPKADYSALAAEVREGKWGNDPQRTQRLTAAGYDATAVQAEVNRQLRG